MLSKEARLRLDLHLELCDQQIDRLLSIPPCLQQVMPILVVKVYHTGRSQAAISSLSTGTPNTMPARLLMQLRKQDALCQSHVKFTGTSFHLQAARLHASCSVHIAC